MKALIEIDGDWQNTYVTAYVHPKYKDGQNPDRINLGSIAADGFDFVINMRPTCKGLNLRLANAPEYENRSFLFVNINTPWKVFDKSLVSSNVDMEVRRSHSLMGWLIYGALTLRRKIKSIFK